MSVVVKSRGTNSAGGNIIGGLVCGLFLVVGSLGTVSVGKQVAEHLAMYRWSTEQCAIQSSSVPEERDSSNHRLFDVHYSYVFGGRSYTSTRFSPDPLNDLNSQTDVQKLLYHYASGNTVSCIVNPENPSEAFLKMRSAAFPFVILFPLLFAVIGAGGIYLLFFYGKGKPNRGGPSRQSSLKPLSRQNGTLSRWALPLFFSVFAAVGTGFGYAVIYRPMRLYFDSATWNRLPCKVESSSVVAHSSKDGTTYSVNITYSYLVNGRTFSSDRYSIAVGSSSGAKGKQEVVDRYPQGSEFECLVDPKDPTESLVTRELSSDLLVGLVPLLFMAVGFGGIFGTWPRREKSTQGVTAFPSGSSRTLGGGSQSMASSLRVDDANDTFKENSGEVELTATSSPVGNLFGITFIALFWNGIVSVFVYQGYQSWKNGSTEWFLILFMIPFVLIGIALIVAIPYSFLALFNPRMRLFISPGTPRLGGKVRLRWEMVGNVSRISKFSLSLAASEEARYRRGTNTYTDRNEFYSLEVFTSNHSSQIGRGEASFEIPESQMHSFSSANNSIIWKLKGRGEIARFPDVSHESVLQVLPSRPQGGSK